MTNRNLAYIVRDQNPLMLPSSSSVKEACTQMWERRVGAVLVVDSQRHLIGIFTGRDAVRVLGEGRSASATPLSMVMTPNPQSLSPEASAIDALRAMSAGGYRHVPIVSGGGKVVGIVSRNDMRGLELDRLEDETTLWERIC